MANQSLSFYILINIIIIIPFFIIIIIIIVIIIIIIIIIIFQTIIIIFISTMFKNFKWIQTNLSYKMVKRFRKHKRFQPLGASSCVFWKFLPFYMVLTRRSMSKQTNISMQSRLHAIEYYYYYYYYNYYYYYWVHSNQLVFPHSCSLLG